MQFVPLDLNSVRLMILSDAPFANAKEGRSHMGFVLAMVGRFDKVSIIHYASIRCRRIARSVMAAEIYTLVRAFDFALVLGDMLTEFLGRLPDVEALVDRKTLFEVAAKHIKTAERRLQINVFALKASYGKE